MVGDAPVQQMSYIAGVDLSSSQFHAVMMGTDGKMYIASTSAQTIGSVTVPANQAWGILQNDPTAGDIATVTEGGHSKAYMGTTANPGQGLKVYDTNGTLGPGVASSRPVDRRGVAPARQRVRDEPSACVPWPGPCSAPSRRGSSRCRSRAGSGWKRFSPCRRGAWW